MPSASAKLEKQTSTETCDPVKQVLTIVEKKVRNLEKRKVCMGVLFINKLSKLKFFFSVTYNLK